MFVCFIWQAKENTTAMANKWGSLHCDSPGIVVENICTVVAANHKVLLTICVPEKHKYGVILKWIARHIWKMIPLFTEHWFDLLHRWFCGSFWMVDITWFCEGINKIRNGHSETEFPGHTGCHGVGQSRYSSIKCVNWKFNRQILLLLLSHSSNSSRNSIG